MRWLLIFADIYDRWQMNNNWAQTLKRPVTYNDEFLASLRSWCDQKSIVALKKETEAQGPSLLPASQAMNFPVVKPCGELKYGNMNGYHICWWILQMHVITNCNKSSEFSKGVFALWLGKDLSATKTQRHFTQPVWKGPSTQYVWWQNIFRPFLMNQTLMIPHGGQLWRDRLCVRAVYSAWCRWPSSGTVWLPTCNSIVHCKVVVHPDTDTISKAGNEGPNMHWMTTDTQKFL